jgi:hypothetical protein
VIAYHKGRIGAFDKNGRVMTIQEWGEKMRDIAYRRIDFDEVEHLEVSTVWLGLDHSTGSGPPVIFETRVFGDGEPCVQRRYVTLAEAKSGHVEIVRDLRNRVYP